MFTLSQVFDRTDSKRDAFLSRLLGLFSEEIVRIWANDLSCPYDDLGRPSVFEAGAKRQNTFDFSLRLKATEEIYVTEMKCWPSFENYRFQVLEATGHLEKLDSDAFGQFLRMAQTTDRTQYTVKIGGKPVNWHGVILIWCHAEPEVIASLRQSRGLHDILSLTNIVNDLIRWDNAVYRQFLAERQAWAQHLFEGLGSVKTHGT